MYRQIDDCFNVFMKFGNIFHQPNKEHRKRIKQELVHVRESLVKVGQEMFFTWTMRFRPASGSSEKDVKDGYLHCKQRS